MFENHGSLQNFQPICSAPKMQHPFQVFHLISTTCHHLRMQLSHPDWPPQPAQHDGSTQSSKTLPADIQLTDGQLVCGQTPAMDGHEANDASNNLISNKLDSTFYTVGKAACEDVCFWSYLTSQSSTYS